MEQRTVLISGASIAGPALAFWLKRHGFRPVVVERAGELRRGGQNIDVRGAARTVVRRMGIEDEIRAATTGEKGIRFVDGDNVTKAELPAGTTESGGFTAEVEILRGDLAGILYDRTREGVEYVFGDWITGLREGDDRITVSFERGGDHNFDLVVAADGIRSRTRALIVGDEPEIRQLGLYLAYLTIPRAASDTAWARVYNAPGGRVVLLRPDNVGTTRALLAFRSPPRGYEASSTDEQKALLRRIFADVEWEAPRVLAALADATDMYFESVGQVHAAHWSRGRGVLVGDAAHCPSPITGMGTSLALVGAYVLAGELAKYAHHRDAFASYEAIMRPYVDRAQKLPAGVPRLMYPKTDLGIRLFHGGVRLASSRLLSRALPSPPADKIDLPDYSKAA
jgi:2-polyprenyl-6-methoxyphenol hydroxylase-like FAD-dependent oxidoreductase